MTIYDVIFILNITVLLVMTVYHCFKNEKKAVISNIVILLLFCSIKFAQRYYFEIRAEIFEILGEEKFKIVRDILSAMLFFGSSVTISIQLLGELFSIFLFVFLATKAAAIFAKKCAKDIFNDNVEYENEKVIGKCDNNGTNSLYLVLEKLIN